MKRTLSSKLTLRIFTSKPQRKCCSLDFTTTLQYTTDNCTFGGEPFAIQNVCVQQWYVQGGLKF